MPTLPILGISPNIQFGSKEKQQALFTPFTFPPTNVTCCVAKYQKYKDILHNSELAREKDKPRDILKIGRSCKIERFFETFELCYPRFNDMTEFLEQYSCVRPHRSQDLLTPPEVYYSCPVQNVSVSRSFCCERKGLSSSARGSRILFVTRCPRAQFRSKLFRRSAAGPNSDESRFSSPR